MATHSTAAAPAAASSKDFKPPYWWQAVLALGALLTLGVALLKAPFELAKLLNDDADTDKQEQQLQKKAQCLRKRVDTMTGIGCQSGDCVTGKGMLIFNDGSIYEGEFKYGQPNGRGMQVFPTGHKKEIEFYAGAFSLGQPFGKGFIQYADGNQYDGEVYGWQRNGRGTYLDANAHKWYAGLWKEDRLIGE